MKRLIVQMVLLTILTVPMLVACSSPSSGATDVLTPDQIAAHKAAKDKKEGGK